MNAHIKKTIQYPVIAVLVALFGSAALGDDLNPAPYRDDPLSVFGHWNLASDGTNNLELIDFSWVDDADPLTTLDPLPPTPLVEPTPGTSGINYQFDLPNIIDDLPIKYMRLQLTWMFTPDPPLDIIISGIDSTGPVTTSIVGSSPVTPTPTGFYQYYDIEFKPNPDAERWVVLVPDNAVLIQAVADTVSTIPEPSTLSILSLGGLVLFRKRK